MTLEVETIVAVSLMMAVFSAVAAVGSSLVLGAGFERLRAGFDIISKQTGFFSDAIHRLEKKVEQVDDHTASFGRAMHTLEEKVGNVGDQANAFTQSVQKLEQKVDIVDKQTSFFSNALHKLEKSVETIGAHEKVVAEKMQKHADTDLISTGKADALFSRAENLLTQMSSLASQMQQDKSQQAVAEKQDLRVSIPSNLAHYVFQGNEDSKEIRYH